MTFEVLWRAYPLIMAALAILAITKFHFIQHKQTNTVLALISFSLISMFLYNGQVECAISSNLVIVAIMLYKSFKSIQKDHYTS